MDAMNLDALKEEIAAGRPLNQQQQAALRELRTKEPHIGPLSAEVARQTKGSQSPGNSDSPPSAN
jgi:hypothetical protein